MLDAVVWGIVQGLTEFLPISSSGHLVLVPAFLEKLGADVGRPDLGVSAVLHLGTLVAVLAYFRTDIARLARARSDAGSRRILGLLVLGSIPAVIGLPLKDTIDRFENDPRNVAGALLITAAFLFVAAYLRVGTRRLEDGTWRDALVVGVAQATALVPGISRSGTTITAGVARSFDIIEAARFSFLLAIPAIAGGGFLSLLDLGETSPAPGAIVMGLIVSAISGYVAIAVLIRILARIGFLPFAAYCLVVGALGIILL